MVLVALVALAVSVFHSRVITAEYSQSKTATMKRSQGQEVESEASRPHSVLFNTKGVKARGQHGMK